MIEARTEAASSLSCAVDLRGRTVMSPESPQSAKHPCSYNLTSSAGSDPSSKNSRRSVSRVTGRMARETRPDDSTELRNRSDRSAPRCADAADSTSRLVRGSISKIPYSAPNLSCSRTPNSVGHAAVRHAIRSASRSIGMSASQFPRSPATVSTRRRHSSRLSRYRASCVSERLQRLIAGDSNN